MRVLDLDMDYFMTEIASFIPEGETKRLNEYDYGGCVWSEEKVIDFLEKNLGLSKLKKIPGRIVKGHNEALFFWKELIKSEKLYIPFDVVHVDSHADLGLGTDAPDYIMKELLKWPVEERPNHSQHINYWGRSCSEGIADYLLYAIAYRWIGSLIYCGNKTQYDTPNDYCIKTLKNFKEEPIWDVPVNNTIQLLYNPTMDCPNPYDSELLIEQKIDNYLSNSVKEPEVPFRIIPFPKDVCFNGDFDFAVLAQSPNYTPLSADFIMDIFREYIFEI